MRNIVSKIDPAYAAEVYDFEFSLVSIYVHGWAGRPFSDWVDEYWQTYTTYYNDLVSFFDTNMDTLLAIYADDPTRPHIARQTAWSMPQFLKMVHELDVGANATTVSTRDAAMAVNVCALMDDIYPDKKIINWAHNYHIRHDCDTMGKPIADAYRPDVYTIGLYMYRGRAAYNHRQVYTISRPSPNSLESVFYCARRKFCYVDLLHQYREAGNAWMFDQVVAKTWGISDVEMILRDQYDGILFIDTVKSPAYLPYP
jgi:erythromycin esterase